MLGNPSIIVRLRSIGVKETQLKKRQYLNTASVKVQLLILASSAMAFAAFKYSFC